MPKRCFYGISVDFLFRCPSVPERKAARDRLCHEWNKPSRTAGKPGRMPYLTTQMNLSQQIRHTSLWMFALFHAHGVVFFLFGCFFLLRISLGIFLSICLCFRLPPFSRLSVGTHQVVILVLGAKVIPGLDGKARSSLLFSGKISSPAGSIFPGKPCIP